MSLDFGRWGSSREPTQTQREQANPSQNIVGNIACDPLAIININTHHKEQIRQIDICHLSFDTLLGAIEKLTLLQLFL